ncbi:RluA family pseudouridine synthase [Candidatus Saccharibacteria bacterium]|nr:RluA family pseudouridine synthase [Candidatus Saccharibacteria bacterium]
MTYSLKINEDNRGKRIDKLLAEQLPQFPRTALQKLFTLEKVTLNQNIARPGAKLRTGDMIVADLTPLDVKIADIDLPIIYQDKNVLVINKPSGVISHARGRYFDEPSVASFVRQISHQQGERAGIVHRLDRATSGVMITAKNQDTLSYLQKQFSNRSVKKTYVAIVAGRLPTEIGVIDMPIGRNPNKPQTFMATKDGRESKTRYKILAQNNQYSLVELSPETGRTHQLRIHLREIGHPIIGDELYGGADASRLMLHAISLEITIPDGNRQIFTAPIPSEFNTLIENQDG